MLRNSIRIFFLFAFFLIQTTFHEEIAIGGTAPNLLLILVCCCGFLRGKKIGMYLGMAAGLLIDIFYGFSGVIGFTALIYLYLGYFNGLFHEIFYTDDICIPVLLTVVSDLIYNLLYYCVAFLLQRRLNIALYFEKIIFPELIYTAVVTVFVFRLLKIIHNRLEKFEKRGEEKLVKGTLGNYLKDTEIS